MGGEAVGAGGGGQGSNDPQPTSLHTPNLLPLLSGQWLAAKDWDVLTEQSWLLSCILISYRWWSRPKGGKWGDQLVWKMWKYGGKAGHSICGLGAKIQSKLTRIIFSDVYYVASYFTQKNVNFMHSIALVRSTLLLFSTMASSSYRRHYFSWKKSVLSHLIY